MHRRFAHRRISRVDVHAPDRAAARRLGRAGAWQWIGRAGKSDEIVGTDRYGWALSMRHASGQDKDTGHDDIQSHGEASYREHRVLATTVRDDCRCRAARGSGPLSGWRGRQTVCRRWSRSGSRPPGGTSQLQEATATIKKVARW